MTGPDRERAVERVIAEYLAAEDVGATPDRAAILAAHPDLAPELRSFFGGHDRFGRLAAPLRGDPAPTVDLAAAVSAPGDAGGLPPGEQVRYFGDYEILEELGRGGMGVVYRARQVSLNRPVALKMIRSGILADADDLRRFQNEVEAVALLDHPGVVPVYEVGELEGQRYFSMKLIEGGGVASGAFMDDPRAAARLVVEAAEAVAHAHVRGVLHRDLKPANLLLDADGHAHVTDFGLAKRTTEDAELTQSGAILGTPAYMSPEQAAGRRGAVTTATDVYGLGGVLYTLLTGRAPFVGESVVETLDAVRTSSPARPRLLNAKIPRDLETICLKCLEKEPDRRYATAQALAEDLRAWLGSRPIAARPTGPLERAALFARRKPAAAAACGLAAAVVFLIGAGGSIAWLWRAAESGRVEAETARAGAEKARVDVEAAHVRLASVEYGRAVQAAYEEWRDDDVVGALAILEGTRPELRGWEWRYVDSLCRPELATFQGPGGRFEPYFDESGTRIATLDGAGTIRFWDARSGAELPGREGRTFVGLDALGRDGARVLAAGDGGRTVVVKDAASGVAIATLAGHAGRIFSSRFDRDGGRVVTASEDGTAKVWDAASGAVLLTLVAPKFSLFPHAEFSPDGTKVATADLHGPARLWDARTGEGLRTLAGHEGGVERAAFSPDGTRVVTAGHDKTARVWDAASGAELLTLRGHARRVFSALFSPDGSKVVTASEDRTARVWDAASGAATLTLKGHGSAVWAARFSPDGSRVITAALGTLESTRVKPEPARIWDAKTGPGPFTLEGGRGSARASFSPDGAKVAAIRWAADPSESRVLDARTGRPSLRLGSGGGISIEFSRDGKRIVTADYDGTARIWDARGGGNLISLKGHGGFLTAASFSPDGSRVVTAGVDGTARLWDARDGREIRVLKARGGRVDCAAFSRDGSRVVTAGFDQAATVWDATTGVEVLRLVGHAKAVASAAYSPDGARIATGGFDDVAKVWDAAAGAEILTLKGHTGTLWSVAFSPDGSRIVTAGGDGTVRLWDAGSGTEVLALKGHADGVRSASFSPDGTRIVSGSDDGTTRVWDARPYAVVRAERADASPIPDPARSP
ncbi:protein kinase domain-containing protein [Paludisphaera mucosa]|uniref:Protein kinase n=1 Tax=Paludisphaera mucosa TaxID=3030827 RepID=A0ABT6FLG6_9BACT|nr:protein kinase [Paludisphaera mucosa]MDG3008423.1 protein kinase [Paludisphaera mucosa]